MRRKKPQITLCYNNIYLIHRIAKKFVQIARTAILRHGKFTVAMTGGETSKNLYNIIPTEIFRENVDYKKIHFFWGDERFVPPDHEESNYRMVAERILSLVPLPENNVHRVPAEKGKKALSAYENEIREFFSLHDGELPRFDLVLIDKEKYRETASQTRLNPGIMEGRHHIVSGIIEKKRLHQLSLTSSAVNAADNIIYLIQTEDQPRTAGIPSEIKKLYGEMEFWFIEKSAT